MRRPRSVKALEEFGRVRLSENFFMRDFLHSEIAAIHGLQNIPDDPDLAIRAGRMLCDELLEPLRARLGRISIRSAFRSAAVNRFGNEHGLNCARNEASHAGHIWDRRDDTGHMGATATVIVHAFLPYYERTGDWEALAWWLHDHLPHDELEFFPRFAAFNIRAHELRRRRGIYSFIPPRRGWLTKAGRDNWHGSHATEYAGWLAEMTPP